MLVKNWMSKNVITISENDSMQQAMSLLKEHKIRMLPVMRKEKVVGVLSESDLRRASASDATTLDMHELLYLISKIKVKDIMSKRVVTVHEDLTVEETAQILLENKISGAPVVDGSENLVGIITKDDLFRVLIALSGLGKKGIQFAFRVEDRSGSIKDLTDIVRAYGAKLASILTSYERVPKGYRNIYLRIHDIDRELLPTLERQLREKATLLYVVDHRDNKRRIYYPELE